MPVFIDIQFCQLTYYTLPDAFLYAWFSWELCFQQVKYTAKFLLYDKVWVRNKSNLFVSSSYGIVAIAPFSHRLAFDNLPSDIQHLRCKVNFHALVFVPHVRTLGDALVSHLRSPPSLDGASSTAHFHNRENVRAGAGKYVVLHLRFDKVWLSSTVLTQFRTIIDYACNWSVSLDF